jgi:hypothetical protein
MANSKLQKIERDLTLLSYSWAADVLTLVFSAAHGLLAGDIVSFADQNITEKFSAAVVAVSTTTLTDDTLTLSTTNKWILPPKIIKTGIWNVGATGAQQAFTFGWANYPLGLIQVDTNTNGTVTTKIEGSLDGIKWVDAAAAQANTANTGVIFEVNKPYIYGRLNFTAVVAGASGKVTAFKVVT